MQGQAQLRVEAELARPRPAPLMALATPFELQVLSRQWTSQRHGPPLPEAAGCSQGFRLRLPFFRLRRLSQATPQSAIFFVVSPRVGPQPPVNRLH